ncbi:unnamed protein product [Candidula unifasciata]|uniref:Death ligand signal enhancer n=1 Tax=Candidula unifasciata TaxID=100452 RepID=A0A8S3Z962_9EUPU|nr:unnamed protein product [Candidula unifasciata]
MWRFVNNISRGFKNHVHSLRPSAGLYVEEEQEALELHEKTCPFSGRRCKSQDIDEVKGCSAKVLNSLFVNKRPVEDSKNETTCHIGDNQDFNTGQQDGSRQRSSCHYDFWRMFSGSHRMLEAISWGSMVLFGADTDRHRYKSRLLFRVLLANYNRTVVRSINSGTSTPTGLQQNIRSAISPVTLPHQQDTVVSDVPVGTQSSPGNKLQTETLDSAMKEFESMCTEYTATTESLLGLEAAIQGDFNAAVQHLQSSCALGNTSACFNLALCYETGSGVPQDLHKAKHYYNLAAKEGHSMALYNLGLMCMQCNNYISSAQATDAAACGCGCNQVQGLNLLEKAAQLGLAQAQTYLGIHHIEQNHNVSKAVPYFRAAAEQHDVEAQYFLAICYEQGWGVELNECLAAQLYSQAASGGHEAAIYNLAVFNEHGLGGLPQDKSSAIDLFQKAADLGCEQAKQRLDQINSQQAKQRLDQINSQQAKHRLDQTNSQQAKQRLYKIDSEQTQQRLGDTVTLENSKVEMFRQLYLQHHQEEQRPSKHGHNSSLSPSASSPNLTEHFHQHLSFFFENQPTDMAVSRVSGQLQQDNKATGISFRLGSDGESEDDDGLLSPRSDRSSVDESFESTAYAIFPSVGNLHKSRSHPCFPLMHSSVEV